MGGAHPAYDFTKALLEAGKSVVTSNKQVVATFGTELLALARTHGVSYLFEASVGGGIPSFAPCARILRRITSGRSAASSTAPPTGILTEMETKGALCRRSPGRAGKGYAEKDPTADIEGLDAARKTVIPAAMAFGKRIDPDSIHCEGITRVTADDAALAHAMGGAVKLIGYASRDAQTGKILAMVSPALCAGRKPACRRKRRVQRHSVSADMVGEVMFYGPGAGKLPTASAVVSDIMEATHADPAAAPVWQDASADDVTEFAASVCRNLLVFDASAEAADSPAAHFGGAEAVRHQPGRLSLCDACAERAGDYGAHCDGRLPGSQSPACAGLTEVARESEKTKHRRARMPVSRRRNGTHSCLDGTVYFCGRTDHGIRR